MGNNFHLQERKSCAQNSGEWNLNSGKWNWESGEWNFKGGDWNLIHIFTFLAISR